MMQQENNVTMKFLQVKAHLSQIDHHHPQSMVHKEKETKPLKNYNKTNNLETTLF